MRKFICCSIVVITASLSTYSRAQGLLGGIPASQEGNTIKGALPTNPGGAIRSAIRDQIQDAIPPNPAPNQIGTSNSQPQGFTQRNGTPGVTNNQNSVQRGANAQPMGTPLLGILRASLSDHTTVGQDGTVRFRNDLNPQLRSMGVLPNDQLVDSNGMAIRDLNSANTHFQANQNVRVLRNGQIVAIQPNSNQSNAGQFGLSFGTKNNGVFISSLVNGSVAANAGLRAGDQIVSINGNLITRPEDITLQMMQSNNSAMVFGYVRNGQSGEASFNSPGQGEGPRQSSASVQIKLDQIERLIGEIRSEISMTR